VKRLSVGQRNTPNSSAIDRGFREIFARRYFANNGPMVQHLDAAIAQYTGVEYAISVANEMTAMMLLAKSLFAPGEIIVPAYLSASMVEALVWGEFTPVFADIDPITWSLSPETLRLVLTRRTTGIVGEHFLGRVGDPLVLERLAGSYGIPLLFDASDALGCATADRRAGSFGVGEVFSLHERSLLNGAEGGCVTTHKPDLAAKLRTRRNFSLTETPDDIHFRMNGKMAEASAMLALAGLREVDGWIVRNRERFRAYEIGLRGCNGVTLVPFDRAGSNYMRVVVDVDEERAGIGGEELLTELARDGIFATRPLASIHDAVVADAPVALRLRDRLVELPNASDVSPEDAAMVCSSLVRLCRRR